MNTIQKGIQMKLMDKIKDWFWYQREFDKISKGYYKDVIENSILNMKS